MNVETKILKDRLKEIRNTLLELEFIKKDVQNLINSSEEQRKEVLSESRFFRRLYINYVRLFVIDAFKLIGKKEDHNIQKLLEFCKINIKTIEWENSISLESLNSLSNIFAETAEKFDQIEGLRNKYYAHNDKKKHSYPYKLSLIELWEVLYNLQSIFSELNSSFDNHYWIFSIQYNTPRFVSNLHKYKQIRKHTLKENRENKSSVEIKFLLNIIRGN